MIYCKFNNVIFMLCVCNVLPMFDGFIGVRCSVYMYVCLTKGIYMGSGAKEVAWHECTVQ